jgi:uroporphyrinogen-III decarboxylase
VIGDIPPGKPISMVEKTDMFKAKTILDDMVYMQGNVPLSLLISGTSDDVKDHCLKFITGVG